MVSTESAGQVGFDQVDDALPGGIELDVLVDLDDCIAAMPQICPSRIRVVSHEVSDLQGADVRADLYASKMLSTCFCREVRVQQNPVAEHDGVRAAVLGVQLLGDVLRHLAAHFALLDGQFAIDFNIVEIPAAVTVSVRVGDKVRVQHPVINSFHFSVGPRLEDIDYRRVLWYGHFDELDVFPCVKLPLQLLAVTLQILEHVVRNDVFQLDAGVFRC